MMEPADAPTPRSTLMPFSSIPVTPPINAGNLSPLPKSMSVPGLLVSVTFFIARNHIRLRTLFEPGEARVDRGAHLRDIFTFCRKSLHSSPFSCLKKQSRKRVCIMAQDLLY